MANKGYNIELDNISKEVKIKNKKKTILSDLSLSINTGEFIAIVGCSGAGKTTLMNTLSGYNKPTNGNVFIEGINLYENIDYFKGKIAYVPQEEILDETLTLQKSLEYSLKLRVKDLNKEKTETLINNILEMLELSHIKKSLIKNLSGGEKKRAAIATEMLSNPSLFLLDEPTSGLDAYIEKKIIKKLKEISESGKTVIITAHTVSNLNLCDKIIFLGSDGKICYYGTYEDIYEYFNVKEFVEIYDILKNDTDFWYKKYKEENKSKRIKHRSKKIENNQEKISNISQIKTLVKRYVSSLINNKIMLLLLLGQSVMMGILICLAMPKDCLLKPNIASMLSVVFTMAASWLGLFNTIQEIVKEKDMIKKEYMSGLNFISYIFSKIIIFSVLVLYQSITCVCIVYFYLNPRLEDTLITKPIFDLIINFFLISFSTSIIGIFISSLVKNTKTALIISPLYMMLQMLFSGMFLPFNNLTKKVSYFVVSRWGYEASSTISNLSKYGVLEPEKGFFKFNISHIVNVWIIFILIILIFLILSTFIIKRKILVTIKNK